jgi:hypothetical protein
MQVSYLSSCDLPARGSIRFIRDPALGNKGTWPGDIKRLYSSYFLSYQATTPELPLLLDMAGLGLSDQKSTARRDHAHRDRRGLLSIHTKHGLLNRLPTKVSFSIFD